ncbi:MAG TPA: hypothetical protein VFA89_14460 [Terriglobales bacterium]|nr:hypothetical protein [Terriglobales bacterium]
MNTRESRDDDQNLPPASPDQASENRPVSDKKPLIDKVFDTVITGEPDEPIKTPRQVDDEIERSEQRRRQA